MKISPSYVLALGLLFAQLTQGDDAAVAGQYGVQKTMKIGGDGHWDYATVDAAGHRLYLTRTTHTEAVDLDTGKIVFDIPGQQRSHGTALVPSIGRGFITDGKAANIVIFDLKTGAVLGTAAAADDVDGIIYDPGTNKVIAGCGDANQLAILDPAADPKSAKADTIDLGGAPEFLAADGKGTVFINLEDKNEIAVVDIKAMKVTNRYATGTGVKPAGLAIDAVHGRLFIGCRNEKMIVMNTADGKVLAELPIGKGNDACGFDPGTGEAFASGGDGTLAIARETSPGKFEVTQTLKTALGARTLAIDPTTHTIYLPTAEFETAPAGARPTMKAGSFMVVVVAPALSAAH